MKKSDQNPLIALSLILLMGWGMALAGSHRGATFHGVPLFAMSIAFAFLIQWISFLPAYLQHNEKFFDLTGSITYISVIILAMLLSPVLDGRSIVLSALVIIWAARLGAFLFHRIRKAGKDARFDEIKVSFSRFLLTYTLQGLWVSFTSAAALAAITAIQRKPLGWFALIGSLLWIFGFAMEVIADGQKSRFKTNPHNKDKFIQSGLWAWSRHPNYFGEIVLWFGVTVIALPVLRGWQYITLISPLFVALLLTRISGIPLLEKRADEKWGGQADYEAYKKRTPALVPGLYKKD
ncbi:DUF1295 domain-containing protein [candidate division KSB1 bacterium]|nr:DUF1295 domain-containing protein [candidate division KSB1 bacterium]